MLGQRMPKDDSIFESSVSKRRSNSIREQLFAEFRKKDSLNQQITSAYDDVFRVNKSAFIRQKDTKVNDNN